MVKYRQGVSYMQIIYAALPAFTLVCGINLLAGIGVSKIFAAILVAISVVCMAGPLIRRDIRPKSRSTALFKLLLYWGVFSDCLFSLAGRAAHVWSFYMVLAFLCVFCLAYDEDIHQERKQ